MVGSDSLMHPYLEQPFFENSESDVPSNMNLTVKENEFLSDSTLHGCDRLLSHCNSRTTLCRSACSRIRLKFDTDQIFDLVIQSVDHLAANSADGWRLEIERLNRELNGIFEVMGQWEVTATFFMHSKS